jgi:hypothetical protein
MTTIYRAAGAADFLALVPRLLGYRASRSIVLIPFDGNRTLGALRMDLPREPQSPEIERLASTAMGLVCKVSHTDAVAVIVYADGRCADADGLPHDAVARALRAQADMCGLRVSEALCVAADGWGSYLDPACPASGRPLSEIPYDHEAFGGAPPPMEDQAAGATLPEVASAERERLARALADIERDMSSLTPGADAAVADDGGVRRSPAASAAACRLDDVPLLFEEALAGDPADLDPYEAAALVWCLMRPGLRDVALVQWVGDLAAGDEALAAQLRYSEGEPYPEHLAARIWGDAPDPDPERLQAALALTRRLASAAPHDTRAGVLAAAAWLAWALGRSTHAGRYAEMAREVDPEHVMAGIVWTFAANGHLPEWVYRRSAPTGPVSRLIDSRRIES